MSSEKKLKDLSYAHIVFLTYKLITSAKHSNDLSFAFDRDRVRRQRQLTENKNKKGNYHVTFMLKVVFGVAEYQEKCSYGLGFISTLTRNKDDGVLSKAPGIADA